MLNIYNKTTVKDYSYHKLLLNKKIALVGPSSNTINTKQCDKIESYDLIVRLNKTFNIPISRQEDIGKRTDILYNSMNTSDFPGQNDFTPELIYDLKKNNLKYISCSYPFIYPFDTDILNFMNINQSQLPVHIMDIVLYKYLTSMLKGRPYTGTCAIIDLLNYPIKELYITGVDCYLNKYYSEYRNIRNRELNNLRSNHIHNNLPQLEFIKKLAINDPRLKLDDFLYNYFFKKDYVIYKKISVKEDITSITNNNIKTTISSINNLSKNKNILYSFKNLRNINNNNIFLINNSLNYNNLQEYSNVYININNAKPSKNLKINNDIQLLIDLNKNSTILKQIKKHTDIKHILLIKYDLISKIINMNIFKNFNVIFINIFVLCHIFKSIIYIDNELLNDLGNKEKDILFYIQYLKKIKIVKI